MTEEQIYVELGRRLRIIRKWRGMNQDKVAGAMRMQRTSLTNAEAGRQRMPLWNLLQLSRIYNVPTHIWLYSPQDWRQWCVANNISITRKVLRTVKRTTKRRVWVEEREQVA